MALDLRAFFGYGCVSLHMREVSIYIEQDGVMRYSIVREYYVKSNNTCTYALSSCVCVCWCEFQGHPRACCVHCVCVFVELN